MTNLNNCPVCGEEYQHVDDVDGYVDPFGLPLFEGKPVSEHFYHHQLERLAKKGKKK